MNLGILSFSNLPELSSFNPMSVWRDDTFDCQASLFIKWEQHFYCLQSLSLHLYTMKRQLFFSCFIHVAPFIQQPCHLTLVCKEKYDQIRTVYVFGKYTSNLS